jgi:hypothetical protein
MTGAAGFRKTTNQASIAADFQLAVVRWLVGGPLIEGTPIYAVGISERQDDYSAAAFVYCRDAQRFRGWI